MIKFNRSGWHGIISEEVTFENVAIIAQAVADYLNEKNGLPSVVLGFDTRFLSREYACTIQRVLTGNGVQVRLHKKPIPTSFLSLSVGLYKADIGIMVTGEGRPARYSGLMFKIESGAPASELWMNNLFNFLYRKYPRMSDDTRQLLEFTDVFNDYSKLLDNTIKFSEMTALKQPIICDSFFGSIGLIFEEILKKKGFDCLSIRTKPNPGFAESVPQPNERNIQPVSKLIRQKKSVVGFFFNGDGSQVGVIDNNGKLLEKTLVSTILFDEWVRINQKQFAVYTDITTPQAAYPIIKEKNAENKLIYELAVDNLLLAEGILWDKDGITFGPFIPDKDAIIQSILLLSALGRYQWDFDKLLNDIYLKWNFRVTEQKTICMSNNVWSKKMEEIKHQSSEPFINNKVIKIEEDRVFKLWFENGAWIVFDYNMQEEYLSVSLDTPEKDDIEGLFFDITHWLMKFY